MLGWRDVGVGTALVLGLASACGGATGGPGPDGAAGSGGTATSTGGSGGGGTSLSVSDFDQSCEQTSDCYPVRDGEQCLCGLCPTAAINTRAASDWKAASEKMACARDDCNHSIICGDTAYACRDNRCVVMDAPNIVASNYDQTCRQNEDCVGIPTGQWCTGCDCPTLGAISNLAYARYTAEVNALACAGTNKPCNCLQPPVELVVCRFSVSGSLTGTCGTETVTDPSTH